MVEIDPVEEQALLYVLGELPANEAREFERRIESSRELMDRVRELEEGAMALALACPPKRAPARIFENIERAIESDRRVVVPWEWFRDKGWAAAAACLVGWLFYAVLTHRPWSSEQHLASSRVIEEKSEPVTNFTMKAIEASSDPVVTVNRGDAGSNGSLSAQPPELAILRTQVAQLRGDLAQISQAVTQQQALLNDPARLKFIGLTPLLNGSVPGTNALSPSLQHAISVAMARELGWLGNSNAVSGARSDEIARDVAHDVTRGGVTNIGGVDFVDLRPQQVTNTNAATPTIPRAPASVDLAQTTDAHPTTAEDISTNVMAMLPAFASADHVTVAMDNNIAPAGSFVTLARLRSNGTQEFIGGMLVGSNPMVVTFNNYSFSGRTETAGLFQQNTGGALIFQPVGEGLNLIVTAFTPGGATNQIQFITTSSP